MNREANEAHSMATPNRRGFFARNRKEILVILAFLLLPALGFLIESGRHHAVGRETCGTTQVCNLLLLGMFCNHRGADESVVLNECRAYLTGLMQSVTQVPHQTPSHPYGPCLVLASCLPGHVNTLPRRKGCARELY